MYNETQRRVNKLQWIAEQAKENKEMRFENIIYLVNEQALLEAFQATRKDGAPGIDGQTGAEYKLHLEDNIKNLLERLRKWRYRAPPVKRAWIPKENGEQRALGLPTFEDKMLQRAVVTLLNHVYEQDFKDCSYGYRPGRGAHDALRALRKQCYESRAKWIVDVDIKGFFDSLNHGVIRTLLQRRIADQGIIRLIGKWLNAGVLEAGEIINPEMGTPQGGVISPLLANICLHYIIDEWFEQEVQPRLKGKCFLVRYADDSIIGCENEEDAKRIVKVLPKRMQRYGLTLNEQKTKLVPFAMPWGQSKGDGTFNFLGFTHYWAKTKKGWWVIKRKTQRTRLRKAIKGIHTWCRQHMHDPLKDQFRTLTRKLQGHYRYFGIQCNYYALHLVYHHTTRSWKHWLGRRDSSRPLSWKRYYDILRWFPLPAPRIIHAWM